MVEFTVALVVIMVLLAGLIQVGQMTSAHTRTMIAARAEAGQTAMAEFYTLPLGGRYLLSWMPGTDTKRYTRDDVPVISLDPIGVNLAVMVESELGALLPANALSTLGMSPDNLDEFFLVKGHDSETCPTLPVIRSLVYHSDTIEVESDAWLVWTEGIY